MANKSLFSSQATRALSVPKADAVTHHGTPAYSLDAFHGLCQLACTGTMHDTFYAGGGDQLEQLIKLSAKVKDEQLAKLAIYARQKGLMKDMPAACLLLLSKRDTVLFHKIFNRVITNGKMLRTFFQLLRSGKLGRKALSGSLSRAFRNRIKEALFAMQEKDNPWLLHAAIGNDPSYRDILRCVHYKPFTNFERAVNGWLADYELKYWAPAGYADLPPILTALDAFRKAENEHQQLALLPQLSKVRWDLLSDSIKGKKVWAQVARNMAPFAMRMNLNTMARHGVFEDPEITAHIASRLSDPEEVKRGGSFPYGYFMAYLMADANIPQTIKTALHKAAEWSCGNVPALPGPVVIGIDTSGSMSSPVTGHQGKGQTSKATCVQVASVFGAALWRRNPDSILVPFDTCEHLHSLDPNDSMLSLAERMSKYGGGGTDCSVPLKVATDRFKSRAFVGCIVVSDNESWFNAGNYNYHQGTSTANEWARFVNNQKQLGKFKEPKYVGINIQPGTIAQNKEAKDVMNVGGFSDGIFETVSAFFENDTGRFVRAVEAVDLNPPAYQPED
jgi:60 kDa SS-A/Ro ribonucleoprotein